jgi:predicted TPR repeat methyltransferase
MNKYPPEFIDIKLSRHTTLLYVVRTLLHKSLNKNLHLFKGTLVDLGCGEMPYKQYILDHTDKVTEYIGIDIPSQDQHEQYRKVKPDYIWDGKKIPLENESADTFIATELFEHVNNIDEILGEIKRVLKNDGLLYFTVPFLWTLHLVPNDYYRYTPYSLKEKLTQAGFKNIHIGITGGRSAALAQMISIWAATIKWEIRGIKKIMFTLFEIVVLHPIIRLLLWKDNQRTSDDYSEGTMPTGFYGYAKN